MSNPTEYRVERPDWWPEGPWMTEPDRVDWTTEAGLPGLILRTRSGHLCGYVAVLPGHPYHGVEYNAGDYPKSPEGEINVHGGLTYSGKCSGNICHVPKPGKPDDVWWFGFDCAHSGDWHPSDYAPYLGNLRSMPGGFNQYRDVPYVTREVERLAKQLISYGKPADIDSADDT